MNNVPLCNHDHGAWWWKTKAGKTRKCRRCGWRLKYKYVSTSEFREFVPGLLHMDQDGVIRVELLDVTIHEGHWSSVGDWLPGR